MPRPPRLTRMVLVFLVQTSLTLFVERLCGWSQDEVHVPAEMLGAIVKSASANDQGRRAIVQLVLRERVCVCVCVCVCVLCECVCV